MQEQLNEFTEKKLQEYGLTISELGYEPVKPGDNNNKPAQSSWAVRDLVSMVCITYILYKSGPVLYTHHLYTDFAYIHLQYSY
jgi:hypothetical protein